MMKQDEIGKHGEDQQALLERPSWRLEPANSADFDLLADIRQQAMKSNMEANGLFDHVLYRQYFKDSFDPASTWKIIEESEVLGFYVLWNKQDHLYLERLYFHPKAQGRGIGADILTVLKQQATAQNKPIRLEVLPKSRANAFYLRQGFELVEEREQEKIYEWMPFQCSDVAERFTLEAAVKSDFDLLADIRQQAMKDEWAANGMFDIAFYREKFQSTFDPTTTRKIIMEGETVGFYVLWDREDHLYLERFYLRPEAQGRGVGSDVLTRMKCFARELGKPITLETFPESRANAFYTRNGFRLVEANNSEKRYEFKPVSLEVST